MANHMTFSFVKIMLNRSTYLSTFVGSILLLTCVCEARRKDFHSQNQLDSILTIVQQIEQLLITRPSGVTIITSPDALEYDRPWDYPNKQITNSPEQESDDFPSITGRNTPQYRSRKFFLPSAKKVDVELTYPSSKNILDFFDPKTWKDKASIIQDYAKFIPYNMPTRRILAYKDLKLNSQDQIGNGNFNSESNREEYNEVDRDRQGWTKNVFTPQQISHDKNNKPSFNANYNRNVNTNKLNYGARRNLPQDIVPDSGFDIEQRLQFNDPVNYGNSRMNTEVI